MGEREFAVYVDEYVIPMKDAVKREEGHMAREATAGTPLLQGWGKENR